MIYKKWGPAVGMFFRTRRKEIMALTYLFLVGLAFGAIFVFYNRPMDTEKNTEQRGAPQPVSSAVLPRGSLVESVPLEPQTPPSRQDWKTHAVAISPPLPGQPQIAVVIDDLGLVRQRTLDMIKLAGPLTLSFLPYGADLPALTRLAHTRGHELMVHMPMEPKGDNDPGPHALRLQATDQENRQSLMVNLSRFDGYVGINNHMGSAFTENRQGVDLLLDEMQKRGLLVLDSRTSRQSVLAERALARHIPTASRDFFLDNQQDVTYILGQLDKLEKMARRRGQAIAIGHPYPETIAVLSRWLPALQKKGITLVPLSHIVKTHIAQADIKKE